MTLPTGIALRSTVFSPDLVLRIAPKLDGSFASAWFPAVSSVDPLDMCAVTTGSTRNLIAGTGVIRLPEWDLSQLASRADELRKSSGNRFVLGVGTGRLVGAGAVNQLAGLAKELRSTHPEVASVPMYFAALGPRMAEAALEAADGVLLNFCSPRYASSITSAKAGRRNPGFRVACYVKLFFAEAEPEARLMATDEFLHYDSLPQYHRMFESMGISSVVEGFRDRPGDPALLLKGEIPEISIANPTQGQLLDLLGKFRKAGVDVPVVYPYVRGDDEYKTRVVMKVRDWLG